MSEPKSDEKGAAPPAGGAPAKAAAKSSPLPLIGAATAALVVGSVLGIFVVAPHVVTARNGAQAGGKVNAEAAHAEKGKGDKPAESVVHKIDNLIVNPAGSQGRRFLMLSVAIEVPDSKVDGELRSKDPMLRDAIIGAVEEQPFDVITGVGGRDSVRAAITRVVRPMVDGAAFVRIYLPQFVLQ